MDEKKIKEYLEGKAKCEELGIRAERKNIHAVTNLLMREICEIEGSLENKIINNNYES
jgi:hypothetical protein